MRNSLLLGLGEPSSARGVGARSRAALLVAVATVLTTSGCGRASAPEATTPPPPATESEKAPQGGAFAPPPPAPSEEAAPRSQPAPAAAGAPMPRSAAKSESDTEGARGDDLDALESQLERAVSLAAPDCTTASSLRDRICDLSQRLCDLAGRSAEPDVVDRCKDGRSRCERATTRVRAACAE